jgi:hypothetical protein
MDRAGPSPRGRVIVAIKKNAATWAAGGVWLWIGGCLPTFKTPAQYVPWSGSSPSKLAECAKKSLGIRSRRTGFGARSQWLWQLPRQSDPAPIKAEAAQERRGPIPIDWVQGVACLHPDRPPNDLPRHRWRQFRDDCKNFLSSSEHWAGRAAQLGWDAMALFGCAPKRPLDCGSSMRGVWGRWA